MLAKINEREIKYQTVIRELVKRYIMKRQQKDQTDGVTEDDLNEIKQDVSAFRYAKRFFTRPRRRSLTRCSILVLSCWKF